MKSKKLTLLVLAFLVLSTVKTNAMKGDLTYEEGAKKYEYTEEDLQSLKRKNDMIEKEIESDKRNKLKVNKIKPASCIGDGKIATLPITCFKQEKTYWCGPATVKQVLNYVNGYSYSQSYYAKALNTTTNGTDMTVIAKYLDKNVKFKYDYSDIGSFSTWIYRIKHGIDYKMPAVLDINTNKIKYWPYRTSGHFVNTSGYNDCKRQVRITDPYGPGLGNKWYDYNSLYKVNSDHFRRAMIW